MLQGLLVIAQFIVARSQCTVSARNLIPVIVLLEQLQGTLGKGNDQFLPRQIAPVDNAHHPRTFFQQEVIILPVLQQFRHGLRSVRLEIHIALLVAQHEAVHQKIELTHHHFFGSRCLVHASGTFHIIIVKKLGSIPLQFPVDINLVNRLQGLHLLLKVIIIDGRSDGKLRAGIVEPPQDIGILHGLLVLADAFHPP